MACYHPMKAWRARSGPNKETGLWPITFNVKEGYIDKEVTLPCGKCIGCRLEKSRQWAVRCMQEASLHEENCFITLTYNEQSSIERCGIIDNQTNQINQLSLNKRDYVLFMKRLRKKYDKRIRFFHCGEYGENFLRPHHHALLLGHDFPDKTLWSVRSGVRLYRSETLESLWPYGYSIIGECTFESAAYVARYVCKKITGDQAENHYDGRQPEYITMSRKPGIGKEWFEKYKSDVLSQDAIIIRNNLKCRPPKYYDNIYHQTNPIEMEKIKRLRKSKIDESKYDYKRLEQKEKFKQLTTQKLKRSFEGV